MISCGVCRFLFIESSCPRGLSDSHISWYIWRGSGQSWPLLRQRCVNRFCKNLQDTRGLPNAAQVVQDISNCGLGCGLEILPGKCWRTLLFTGRNVLAPRHLECGLGQPVASHLLFLKWCYRSREDGQMKAR